MSTSIEKVEIRGEEAPAEWFGFNALNAIDVESVVGDDPHDHVVDRTVRAVPNGVADQIHEHLIDLPFARALHQQLRFLLGIDR